MQTNIKVFVLIYIPGFIIYTWKVLKKGEYPVASIIIASYILILSLIPHKEARFMLPFIPFVLLQVSFVLKYLH